MPPTVPHHVMWHGEEKKEKACLGKKKKPHHSYESVVSHSRLVIVLAGGESHGGATARPLPLAARLSQHSIRADGEHGVPILLGVERGCDIYYEKKTRCG